MLGLGLCVEVCEREWGDVFQAPWFNTWNGVLKHLRRI